MALTSAERGQKFAPRRLVEHRQVHRAVAFIAQHFDPARPPLFRRRLELADDDSQKGHLKRLHEKILSVSAVGARKRQCVTPSDRYRVGPSDECIALFPSYA